MAQYLTYCFIEHYYFHQPSVLLAPWRPWSASPYLDAAAHPQRVSLEDITVLIPARNEARLIAHTLDALAAQGSGLNVLLVDDQSTDDTAAVARRTLADGLRIVQGRDLPPGWSGKLWALEQGRRHITTPYILLMDADIELAPGILPGALTRLRAQGLDLLSLMAVPHMSGFWALCLMPAFVYFFKLLYPFRLSNSRFPGVAAAAGGFVLLKTRALEDMGGFGSIRGELIDDCALAGRLKRSGARIWMGLTHSVASRRPYARLGELWDMEARTAFTQLHDSWAWLALCTLTLVLAFAIPVLGLGAGREAIRAMAVVAGCAMLASYLPVLRFYGRSPLWALGLPLIGMAFLAMTWDSALRYWRGERANWRGRRYTRRT
jgi:hopene-associated glycosyltransferase HpnB